MKIRKYKITKNSQFHFSGKNIKQSEYHIKEYLVSTPFGLAFVSSSKWIGKKDNKEGSRLTLINEGISYETHVDRFIDTQQKATRLVSKFIEELKQ